MNDTMPMGCAKGVRNLNGVLQHLLQRERPFLEPGGEGLALEVSQGSRFRLDGRRSYSGQICGKNLDGNDAVELRISGAMHLAHSAGADRGDDFVRAQSG